MSEFADKIRSIGVLKATPRDKALDKDMAAYKRLRKNGLQPPTIDGCADLESKATSQEEINYGKILTKEQQKEARARMDGMRDA